MIYKCSEKMPMGYKLFDHYLGQSLMSDNLSELIQAVRDYPKWHFDLCRLYVIKDERGHTVKYLIPFDYDDLREWVNMVKER